MVKPLPKPAVAYDPELDKSTGRKEAAEFLGCSKGLLEKLACTGGGPKFAKLGTGISAKAVYTIRDLIAWRDSHTKER